MTPCIFAVFCAMMLAVLSSASFSVHMSVDPSRHAQVIRPSGDAMVFTETPSADHVADLFARTTGRPPLLSEGITKYEY